MIKLKNRLRDAVLFWFLCIRLALLHFKKKKAVIFISTPTHGNLGDQAIVYSQYQFFRSLGVEKQIVEIHRYQYELWSEKLMNHICPTDLIIIDGGGNMGTLWPEEEHKMQDIVLRFVQNPVFVFPQTASYSDDEAGQMELTNSRMAYGSNSKFFVFTRDKYTQNTLKEKMPELHCMYTPDMVMFIENTFVKKKREGIAFCLRKDLEQVLTEEQRNMLKKEFEAAGQRTRSISTVIPETVWAFQRNKILHKKWEEFSGIKLIITDRLHGLVFAAITGTPCIALDNVSHKVLGAYQWLSYLTYIRFCNHVDEVKEVAEELLNLPQQKYDMTPLLPYYDEMKRVVKNALETV